jgi:VanZ family protein
MKPHIVARWVWPALVGFIYSTLSVARIASNWLRDHGVLRLTVAGIFVMALAAVVGTLVREVRFRTWRLVPVFLAIAAVGALIAWKSQTPEERLHLVEYGMVALVTDLALPLGWTGWRRFLAAALITVAVGWCDELIQGLLPNRHYDLHDVLLNAESGVWALLGKVVVMRVALPKE